MRLARVPDPSKRKRGPIGWSTSAWRAGNGKVLRVLPLIERKAMLKKLLRRKRSRILYLDHIETAGRLFFQEIVKMDLEGIVCKRKDSPYKVTENPCRHWIKVKERAVQPTGRA